MRRIAVLAAATALTFMPFSAAAAPGDPGRDKVVAAIHADKAASVERLKQWIALPTIANMGMNHKEGAEHMRQLALDAGFQKARIVETGGVPGVFATLDAGAKDTLATKRDLDVMRGEIAKLGGELHAEIHRAVSASTRQMYMALLGHMAMTLGFIYFLNTQLR